MASSGFLLILLLFATRTLSGGRALNLRGAQQDIQVKVWTGQTVNMKCGDIMNDSISRFWSNDIEVLAAANMVITSDERFSVDKNSVELILANVTLEDEGNYICTVNTSPRYTRTYQLEVTDNEPKCNHPESPQYGGIKILSLGDGDEEASDGSNGTVFRFGARILYYCNKGYFIFGDEIRTCIGPTYDEWTGKAPTCEHTSVTDLRASVAVLYSRISGLQTDNKGIAKLDLKMTNMEDRMTKLEGVADASSKNLERIEGLDAKIQRLQTVAQSGSQTDNKGIAKLDLKMTNMEDRMAKLEGVADASSKNLLRIEGFHAKIQHPQGVAQLGIKDGHIISEFAWTISDIYEKIEEHRSEKIKYVESSPFYTHIPGYKMQLRFYFDQDYSGYISMYAILLQGEFDEFITWPFTSKYQLSLISRNKGEVTAGTIVPGGNNTCNFDRQRADNFGGCGFPKFMSHEDFNNKQKLYLYGKAIFMKITIYIA